MATKQYVFNKEDVAKLAKQYAGEFDNVEFYVKTKLQFTQMQSKVKLNTTVCTPKLSPPPSAFHLCLCLLPGQDHEQAFSKVVVELRKR